MARRLHLRSLFDSVFHRPVSKAVDGYFGTFTAYAPVFTSWQGGIYEAELTRAVIESGADHASKLKPEISGTAKPKATRTLRMQPNPWETTPQFIRRCWTILQVCETCLIVRVSDRSGAHIGYFPAMPGQCAAYDVGGELWLKLTFPDGREQYIPWNEVGVLTRHQYRSDLFGDGTDALQPTLELLHSQMEGEQNAIKQNAAIRFLGKYSQNLDPEDMRKKQQEFNKQNLGTENTGGIAVYDRGFENVIQVKPTTYTVDTAQMERIEKSVYRYFGNNEDVVLNRANEEVFNSFYEGRIEPFAVQLGTVLTCMTFTPYEISCGNEITFSANRLEFASNKTKLSVATALFDRGIWCGNDVADVFQTAHYDGGDKHVIRGEYIDLSLISQHTAEQAAQAAQTNAAVAQIDAPKTDDKGVTDDALQAT
ncbi:MAG: phage portal protein [Atopobiaceae bacterium]|nr:phage portal protein [Atopobiaceae bacterium]